MKKLLTIAIVLALLSVSIAIAGNAYGKVKNTQAARDCAGINQLNDADELGVVPGVGDEVVQCLQSKGIALNSGVCTPEPDGCCYLADKESDPGDCGGEGPSCTDSDGDGYGDPASAACTHSDLDCDDTSNVVYPGADEVCDPLESKVDNDCDGQVDESACGVDQACDDTLPYSQCSGNLVCHPILGTCQ